MMPARHTIEDILRADLEDKKATSDRAREAFRVAASELSGLPHPAGQANMTNAVLANSYALHDYTTVLREFNGFILEGNVPERLKHLKPAEK